MRNGNVLKVKHVAAFAILFFSSFIIACLDKETPPFRDGYLSVYEIIGFDSKNYRFTQTDLVEINEGDTLLWSDHLISYEFDRVYIAEQQNSGELLMATSPAPPVCTCRFDTAFVLSLFDYNGDGVAIDTIMNQISVSYYNRPNLLDSYIPFDSLFYSWQKSNYMAGEPFIIKLDEAPIDSFVQARFEFVMKLEDGRVLRDTSKIVVLSQ